MPSSTLPSRLFSRLTTQRNLTIITAIVVAVPTAYAFHSFAGGPEQVGDFLLLMTLAVGVPTAYDEYWPRYEQPWLAIAWVVVACLVATVEFVGFYVVGTDFLDLSPFFAAAGAFLLTYLGNLAWLATRRR